MFARLTVSIIDFAVPFVIVSSCSIPIVNYPSVQRFKFVNHKIKIYFFLFARWQETKSI